MIAKGGGGIMTTGIIKWYDETSMKFAIVEQSADNKLVILDTTSLNISPDSLKEGDKVSFKIKLSPFGPIAKEIIKI